MSGWIKIHRKLFDHWCSSDPNFIAVWVRLLSDANHQGSKALFNSSVIEIKRGSLIFGREVFSSKTGVSVSKLRRIMDIFVSEGMISQQKTNKYTIVSITCYEKYQVNDQQTTNKTPTKRQQNATSKEVEEVEEVKEKIEGTAFAVLKPKVKTNAKKGQRLPEGWAPSETLAKSIADRENLTAEQISNEAYRFCNYWLAASGSKAIKLDWDRTFRNWCSNANGFGTTGVSGTARRGGGSQGAVQLAEAGEKAAIKRQDMGEEDFDPFA